MKGAHCVSLSGNPKTWKEAAFGEDDAPWDRIEMLTDFNVDRLEVYLTWNMVSLFGHCPCQGPGGPQCRNMGVRPNGL